MKVDKETQTTREQDCLCFTKFFAAMSDPTRQQIACLLHERNLCVSELVRHFSLCQPTISRHLAVLENAGIVSRQRRGQHVFYSLNREKLLDCCLDFASKFGVAEGGEKA